MRFSPSTLASEDSMEKMKNMLHIYFGMGGMEVQYNIVTSETLRAA
jgi:formate C-acetyltransferase